MADHRFSRKRPLDAISYAHEDSSAFWTSWSRRTETLTKPGDASCRAMSARTRTAPMVGHRPERQRFSLSHPPRAHGDPRALRGDGKTSIHPSGRPGLVGPFT